MNVAEKINILNKTTLESLDEADARKIIATFTETGMRILGADFAYSFWKQPPNKTYRLVYTSPNMDHRPRLPRKDGFTAMVERTKQPYLGLIKKEKLPQYDLSEHMKSIVIVPIFYKKHQYGDIVLAFKSKRNFTKQDKSLATFIGNSTARSIIINGLYFDLKDFKHHLDKTLDLVFIFDPVTFKIEYANLGAAKHLGFTQAELLKKTFFDIETKAEVEKFQRLVTPLFWKKQDSLDLETSLISKNGKKIPMELFLQLSGSLKGRRKFLCIAHDITARRQMEQETKLTIKQKDEFLGIASHELKTPVTTIKGFTQLLAENLPKRDTGLQYFVNKINIQAEKLTRLVNDLLDISRIENGKLKFRRGIFDLRTLLENLAADFQVSHLTHQIILKLSGHYWIFGDEDRIGQVIINLVTNAIKYSPRAKKVIISLSEKDGKAKVSVEDFGIGIKEKNQAKIFERFFQDKKKGETYPGLGLGLYIASKIIKFHKGEIFYESKSTKGSIFSFILPYKKWEPENKQS